MPAQLSLFSAEMHPPAVADLAGVLAGPGQAVRRGEAARLSVLVGGDWRADALLAAFAAVGVRGERAQREGGNVVRTEFSPALLPIAREWLRGAVKRPPAGFGLDAARLRLWSISAGRSTAGGYLLGLGPSDDVAWAGVGAALAAAGLAGAFIGPRAGGPAYRVTGRRRLLRLAELVGDPPPGAADDWVSP